MLSNTSERPKVSDEFSILESADKNELHVDQILAVLYYCVLLG